MQGVVQRVRPAASLILTALVAVLVAVPAAALGASVPAPNHVSAKAAGSTTIVVRWRRPARHGLRVWLTVAGRIVRPPASSTSVRVGHLRAAHRYVVLIRECAKPSLLDRSSHRCPHPRRRPVRLRVWRRQQRQRHHRGQQQPGRLGHAVAGVAVEPRPDDRHPGRARHCADDRRLSRLPRRQPLEPGHLGAARRPALARRGFGRWPATCTPTSAPASTATTGSRSPSSRRASRSCRSRSASLRRRGRPRALPNPGQRARSRAARPATATATCWSLQQGVVHALRAVQRVPGGGRRWARGLRRGVRPALERAAPRRLDAAPTPPACRSSPGWRAPTRRRRGRSTTRCASRSAHPARLRLSRRATSRPRAGRVAAADGDARPPQGELQHRRLPRPGTGDPQRAQDLRHDPRRQRLELVHLRHARPAWYDDDLDQLKRVPGTAFEVVNAGAVTTG